MRLAAFFVMVLLFACQKPVSSELPRTPVAESKPEPGVPGVFANTVNQLDNYWYQGMGELNVYDLAQNRYQGIHPGEALLVFVSEDFLTDKQVKNDRYQNPNSTPILKTNAIIRFTTGIYDYSLMTSVFTPVKTAEFSHTLKVTNTGQDWCGQVYSQLNLQGRTYHYLLHSYFETEADQTNEIEATLLEDEVFNRIRMGWQHLPTGSLLVIPSANFLRLRHQPVKAFSANLSLSAYQGDDFKGTDLKVYTLSFPDLQRRLEIVFQALPPYYIEGWIDTYPSAFDGQLRSTKAKRRTTTLEKYWEQNANSPLNAAKRADLKWE